jgi:hypothetical protein
MMLGWLLDREAYLARREAYRELVERDASDLIERLGATAAYAETAFRIRYEPETLDGNRPTDHWSRVRAVIAKRLGVTSGLTGWDMAGR